MRNPVHVCHAKTMQHNSIHYLCGREEERHGDRMLHCYRCQQVPAAATQPLPRALINKARLKHILHQYLNK